MTILSQTQDKLEETLNAEGRSPGHVAAGVAVCLALVGVTAALAVARPQPVAPGAKPSRHPWIRAAWPALSSVTTLAALRVWNAPSGPRRSRALAWWSVLQASNLALMVWRPRDRNAQLVAAVATAGLTAAYAQTAAHVDQKAAGLVAPTGFAGLASLVAQPGPH